MVLRPLPVTRLANILPGLCVGFFGCAALVNYLPPYVGLPAGFLVWTGGMVVAVRGYLMGVEVAAGRVKVRGLLRTRTIPCSAIPPVVRFAMPRWLRVTGLAALHWVSPTGRPRWTPLVMFTNSSPQLKQISRHNRQSLAMLRQAIHNERTGPG